MMKQIKNRVRQLGVTLTLLALLVTQALAAVPAYLIPGGNTVGIKLYTRGLVITAVSDGMAAQAAGLKAGDTILAADGDPVRTAQSLCAHLQEGKPVVLTVLRGEQEAKFLVSPEKTEDGCRLGLTLRDHIAGIGTVTYYDPDSRRFGALGHGVSSAGDLRLTPAASGFVVSSRVVEVRRGSRGNECGVFGVMQSLPRKAAVPVAQAGEAHTGAAAILSNVSGTEIREYTVEILKLYPDAGNGRNLLLKVTDPALLEKTGGIVQGMSGSPILQDGKLIGAVTHVLVNSPDTGYGIFIENMLDAAG